jgi:thioredoxin-like negative regulator of GroEL
MFKRSFFLVSLVFLLVFASAFASQIWMTRDLPSTYDQGLTIEKAFKTSKVPLLIEFYSDTCGTCKRLAPVIHALESGPYQGRLTLVMMDVSEGANQDIARLFGVDSLPGLYVFDHRHMKKHAIPAEAFTSQARLQKAIDEALALSSAPARPI